MKAKKKHGKVSEDDIMIIPIFPIERNDFTELFVQPSKYNIIPFDFDNSIKHFTPAYLNTIPMPLPAPLSEAEKEDLRKSILGSADYIISVDPSIDEIDSPSFGYVYVADVTKTPMEILETYKITKNGLERIETPDNSQDIKKD